MDCKNNCVKMINLGRITCPSSRRWELNSIWSKSLFRIKRYIIRTSVITSSPMDIPKKVFLKVKKLHIRCGGIGNIEHLYLLPSRWLYLLKFENFGDAIDASCTLMQFFVEENLVSWHPKTHGPCNYLQSFIWLLSFINWEEKISICWDSKFYCRQKHKIISERKW